MSWKIKELKLPGGFFYRDSDGNRQNVIVNLSKINIFIGENNSGKSRLIRSIAGTKELQYRPIDFSLGQFNKALQKIKTEIAAHIKSLRINPPEEVNSINRISENDLLTEGMNNPLHDLQNFIGKVSVMQQTDKHWQTDKGKYTFSDLGKDFLGIVDGVLQQTMSISAEKIAVLANRPPFNRIYIPILRGLRPLSTGPDVYLQRTQDDYFKGAPKEITIFTGQTVYQVVKDHRLGELRKRKLIDNFENFLSQQYFDQHKIAIIPTEAGSILTIKIGEEQEQPIYNLGDGIQSIIIHALPLFLHSKGDFLAFMEEPEHLLHPGLQRKLLEMLSQSENSDNFQFFLTTHSNHFLDMTLDFGDVSIFAVRKSYKQEQGDEKIPEFVIENLSVGDRSSLDLLGVRNSSVYLSNCTIWVEGITDRRYLRHYLLLYQESVSAEGTLPQIKEDLHYSFVEYAGSNITHWSFLDHKERPINVERLCGRLLLIVDKDEKRGIRHTKLRKLLGDRLILHERREMENLISEKVLASVITELEGGKDAVRLNSFKYLDYKDEYLGSFIEEKVLPRKGRNRSYKSESGSLRDKMIFCDKVIKHTTHWDDLSRDAQKLTERVYLFIVEMNGLAKPRAKGTRAS